ncbi:hypothetical protein RhiirB3_451641 [Rhizophagus irregularis]|nr:hypothetical protein RhiirB3_451641 [Rhizophagus irregularis]
MQVPYYFVADFEVILKTKKIQEYIPCSFAYIKVYYDGQLYSEKIYVRLNTAQRFIIEITQEVMAIYEEYKQSKPIIPLLPEEEEIYNNAEHCWVCEKEFERLEEKARDHCHITDKYREAAHSAYNLQLQIKVGEMHIPVIFYNLSGYNSHRTRLLIIKVTVENCCFTNSFYLTFFLNSIG